MYIEMKKERGCFSVNEVNRMKYTESLDRETEC